MGTCVHLLPFINEQCQLLYKSIESLTQRLEHHSWNCVACQRANTRGAKSLEDYEYNNKRNQKKTNNIDTSDFGFLYCISCLQVLCSYHYESHCNSHNTFLNFNTSSVECRACNLVLQPTNISHAQNILQILHKVIYLFNLIRSMPQTKSLVCSSCNLPIQQRYKCQECKNYNLCPSCWSVVDTVQHRHDKYLFYYEKFPPWILPLLVQADSSSECLMNIFQFYSQRPAIGEIINSQKIQWHSFSDFYERIKIFGNGLAQWVGNSERLLNQKIIIATELSYNSFVLDYACFLYGLIPIRIHPNTEQEQWEHLISKLSVNIIAVNNFSQWNASNLLHHFEKIRIISLHEPASDGDLSKKYSIASLTTLEELGKNCNPITTIIRKPEDILMILCSSGSTGTPKLFPMEDQAITNQMKRTTYGTREHPNITAVWNYSDRINSIFHLYSGGNLLLCSPNAASNFSKLFSEIKLCRPTFLVGTPLFWNAVYQHYKFLCIQTQLDSPSITTEEIQQIHFKSIKRLFGNRLKQITTGGAAISPETLELLKKSFPIVVDRYGSTETGAIASNGVLLKHISIRLRDWGEYKTTDYPHPRGELIVKSSKSSGWHETGDIVTLYTPTRIKIIDRKQNIVKLANGEWFNPEIIEYKIITSCSFIQQIFLFPSYNLFAPVGLLTINQQQFERIFSSYFPEKSIHWADTSWRDSADVKYCILSEIHRNTLLRGCEIPSHVTILETPFSVQSRTITMSMKLCRPQIRLIYQNELASLVNQAICEQSLHFASTVNDCSSNHSQIIQNILQEILPNYKNQHNSFLMDSFSAVQFTNQYKKSTGNSIDPVLLSNSQTTLTQLQSLLTKLTSTNSQLQFNPLEYVDIQSEKQFLDEILSPLSTTEFSLRTTKPTNILLTGATGFLGTFMLQSLLQETDAKIYCLVRCETCEAGKQRVVEGLRRFQCLEMIQNWKNRIEVVCGSLDQFMFGLDEPAFLELSCSICSIFHAGAVVSGLARYHSLRATNVQGTLECFRLAVYAVQQGKDNSVPRMNFISTGAVFNGYPPGVINEDFQLSVNHSLSYMDGYSRSKWVSDYLSLRAMKKFHFPVCIFRPGFISSHSEWGVGNIRDFDNRLVLGILQMKFFPNDICPRSMLDQSPVDWVAESIVKIGLLPESLYSCFHFMNPKGSPGVCDFLEAVRAVYFAKFGCNLEGCSYAAWREKLLELSHDNPIFMLREFFGSSFPSRSGTRMDLANTKQFQKQLGIPLVKQVTNLTLQNWIHWLLQETQE